MKRLHSETQELISSVYRIVQSELDSNYEFICYYDQQENQMGYGLAFGGAEVKLFDSIPAEIVVEYANFITSVKAYEDGADFPYEVQRVEQEESEDNEDDLNGLTSLNVNE